ncbi:DUF502 domain-containing protein [Pseudokordiimonas caeni]|uniref:DUF502 domain-containing protein n=1 Tax=Pseudokordiimonas caeni TaxID=2997908 RepID=UPI0028118688|nr:DUF502 domain-containing protein [Pseudokordiimonas caeni]
MTETAASRPPFPQRARRYIIVGLFTLVPLWLTFWALGFILDFVRDLAQPMLNQIVVRVPNDSSVMGMVTHPWFQTALAVAVLLSLFYFTGWLASRWVGQKAIMLVDGVMARIPVAKSIYNAVKRLTDAMNMTPSDFQRVVLIEFPNPDMKTVGLVTKTFKDANTGRELAAVYVPTTPNPTSGYLEIVPVEKLTPTNWKMDEAMSFVISGGADVPKNVIYDMPPKAEPKAAKKKEPEDQP